MSGLNDINKLISDFKSKADKPLSAIDKAANPEKLVRQVGDIRQNFKQTKADLKSKGKRIIDLGNRFQNAFGFVSTNQGSSLKNSNFSSAINTAGVFVRDPKTTFEEIKLVGNKVELKFGYMDLSTGLGDVFAPPPMVSFSKKKRMERTVLQGTEAEVVENYGHEPWDITIKGLLVDMENHVYPKKKIESLIALFGFDGIWEVYSEIFKDHGIASIYIEAIDDSGVEGFEDTWQYTLKAYSIKPVEYSFK